MNIRVILFLKKIKPQYFFFLILIFLRLAEFGPVCGMSGKQDSGLSPTSLGFTAVSLPDSFVVQNYGSPKKRFIDLFKRTFWNTGIIPVTNFVPV